MSAFERYLTLWVAACIVVGIGLGHLLPGVFHAIGEAEIAKVNMPVAGLIWLMIIPMLVKIDFAALGEVRRHWRGIGVTLFVNWAVKPFSMALLGWIFISWLFRPYLPAAQINSYVAGLILLAAAPCTAMVFVWSNLSGGEPHFTLSQVAFNDVIMVFAYAPIVALLLGLSAITVPWDTLLLSVGLYIVVPVVIAQLLRRALLSNGGPERLAATLKTLGPVSLIALLTTLVLLFGFQGKADPPSTTRDRAAGGPDPDRGVIHFRACISAQSRRRGSTLRGCAISAHWREQLLRARGRGSNQPLRLRVGSGSGDGRRCPDRGAGHAFGGQDRECDARVVRTACEREGGRSGPPRRGAQVNELVAITIRAARCKQRQENRIPTLFRSIHLILLKRPPELTDANCEQIPDNANRCLL